MNSSEVPPSRNVRNITTGTSAKLSGGLLYHLANKHIMNNGNLTSISKPHSDKPLNFPDNLHRISVFDEGVSKFYRTKKSNISMGGTSAFSGSDDSYFDVEKEPSQLNENENTSHSRDGSYQQVNNEFGTHPSSSRSRSRKDKMKNRDRSRSGFPEKSFRRTITEEYDTDMNRIFPEKVVLPELERLKEEMEKLKKTLHDSKKVVKKQAKVIEELRAENNAKSQTTKERDEEIRNLKTKFNQNETLLNAIEMSVRCQICTDLPYKPYVLAPCGHVLCLLCLQEWFRRAPPSADDADANAEDLSNPLYIVSRAKSCPCCRTVVKYKPAPVFMVKDVAMALSKSGYGYNPFYTPDTATSTEDGDPWSGIFPDSDDEEEDYLSDDSSSDDFIDATTWFRDADALAIQAHGELQSSDRDEGESTDGSEDEASEDDYTDTNSLIEPSWEPPRRRVNQNDYLLGNSANRNELNLLRRGCTMEMIQEFTIEYTHSAGIIVHLRSLDDIYFSDNGGDNNEIVGADHRVFLGWNIELDSADVDGEEYMHRVLNDIKDHPERWLTTRRPGHPGTFDVKRLLRAGLNDEYLTSDTELYLDSEDSDST